MQCMTLGDRFGLLCTILAFGQFEKLEVLASLLFSAIDRSRFVTSDVCTIAITCNRVLRAANAGLPNKA